MATPLPDYVEFVKLHPQFSQCNASAIKQAICNAALFVDEAIYGPQYLLAVRMKACHILAVEMYGQQASLKGGETTVYQQMFEAIQKVRVPRSFVT